MGLFEPYRIGNLELRNRFVRSATFDATADSSGAATDASVTLYRELGHGGVGLIVTGYAFVSPEGQALPGQYGVHADAMVPGLRRLADAAHEGGSKIALQIVHAGNSSSYLADRNIEALSVSKMRGVRRPHREMTDEEIEAIVSDFASAAKRAKEAGFDALQLHGAHGYLMSQFLSPLLNRRTDRWGGAAENRRRFHLRVIRKIREAIGPDYPLMIKFGVKDDRERGLSLDEGLETARRMVERGIEAIEVSAGVGTPIEVRRKSEAERPYFRARAAAVKRAVAAPVMAVGGIRSLEVAESIVDSGDADLVSMCRPFIREPGLVARWAQGNRRPATCISCSRCLAVARTGEPLRCVEEHPSRE